MPTEEQKAEALHWFNHTAWRTTSVAEADGWKEVINTIRACLQSSGGAKIEPLYFGDKHADAIYDALWDVLVERAANMPIPTIIGVLELVTDKVKENSNW